MNRIRTLIVGVLCAVLGAGFVLVADAQTGQHGSKRHHRTHRGFAHAGARAVKRAVHAEAVVPVQNGTKFATVTYDRGTVKSVAADSITLTEGTRKATYKDVTVSVPA